MERVAEEEYAAGHRQTALELFYMAAKEFGGAQHPVLETTDEKRFLHGRCIANYDKVIELSPNPIERVEIPFDGYELQCNFHMVPGRPKAPAVIFIPGCDMVKEQYPEPKYNHALDRGMHLLVMDGPGQGMSNIRGKHADLGQLRPRRPRHRRVARRPRGGRCRKDRRLFHVDGLATGGWRSPAMAIR